MHSLTTLWWQTNILELRISQPINPIWIAIIVYERDVNNAFLRIFFSNRQYKKTQIYRDIGINIYIPKEIKRIVEIAGKVI